MSMTGQFNHEINRTIRSQIIDACDKQEVILAENVIANLIGLSWDTI